MGNTHWNEDEIRTLKERYGNTPMYTLVEMLPRRTEQGIRAIATRIGLENATWPAGVNHRKSTFFRQPEVVEAIRCEYATGVTLGVLAEKYGVAVSLIFGIVSGKRYAECGGPVSDRRHRLTRDDVMAIRWARINGMSLKELAEEYGISESMTSRIALGRRHEDKPGPIVEKPYSVTVRTCHE